jgi:hypothetical protein
MLETYIYSRRPFKVEAVCVTVDNLAEVAAWCHGEAMLDGKEFVVVPVKRPMNKRQTMAMVGDWVLKSAEGFKVYTKARFERDFVLNEMELDTVIQQLELALFKKYND